MLPLKSETMHRTLAGRITKNRTPKAAAPKPEPMEDCRPAQPTPISSASSGRNHLPSPFSSAFSQSPFAGIPTIFSRSTPPIPVARNQVDDLVTEIVVIDMQNFFLSTDVHQLINGRSYRGFINFEIVVSIWKKYVGVLDKSTHIIGVIGAQFFQKNNKDEQMAAHVLIDIAKAAGLKMTVVVANNQATLNGVARETSEADDLAALIIAYNLILKEKKVVFVGNDEYRFRPDYTGCVITVQVFGDFPELVSSLITDSEEVVDNPMLVDAKDFIGVVVVKVFKCTQATTIQAREALLQKLNGCEWAYCEDHITSSRS